MSYREDEAFSNDTANQKHVQFRSQSQINNQAFQTFNGQIIVQNHNQRLTHQLDDISSISGCDANTNPKDQNSFLINTFIGAENNNQETISNANIMQINEAHERQQSLTRQPSINLLGTSSSTNLRNHIQHVQQQRALKRDISAQSELQQLSNNHQFERNNQNKFNNQNLNKNQRHQPRVDQLPFKSNLDANLKPPLNGSQNARTEHSKSLLIDNKSPIHEFQINNQLNYADIKSIISFVCDQREALIKRNIKNDKRFNLFQDNLTNYEEEKRVILENAIYLPLIYEPTNQLIGLIQVSNNEKLSVFTEQDLQTLQAIADKFTKYLVELKESKSQQVLFKKQLEVSLLSQSMENQSVTKILHLANKLFAKKRMNQDPLIQVYKFVSGCEQYLKKIFNCGLAQILFVDESSKQLISLQSKILPNNELLRNEGKISLGYRDPIVWPQQSDYILIGEGETSERSLSDFNPGFNPMFGLGINQTMAQQLFNPQIDSPAGGILEQCPPSTFLAICVKDKNTERVLAIIELMVRQNGLRFFESDSKHLAMISSHISQIFTHINNEDCFQIHMKIKNQAILKLSKIFTKKVKHNYKHLFRELLAFKFGQQNLLKNKIMRKFLDRHLKVDNILIEKIKKLVSLRQKCAEQNKLHSFNKLKSQLKELTEKRQKNAQKCIHIVNKYDKLLSIRVKDTVFKFWEQFKKQDISGITNGLNHTSSENREDLGNENFNGRQLAQTPSSQYLANMYSTFNVHQDQSSFISNDQMNQSSILDESSVTSTLYLKAKACYKFRRLFNQFKLRIYLDTFKLKTLNQIPSKKMNMLNFNESTVKLIKLHHILGRNYHQLRKQFFGAFKEHSQLLKLRDKILKRLIEKRQKKFITFGIKTWQTQTESSIRNDLKQEKSYVSVLTEQCKEGTILQMMMIGINKAFQNNHFQSIDECLNSPDIKQLFINLSENIQSQTLQPYSLIISFKLPQSYHLSGQYYALFLYPCQEIDFNRTTLNNQLSHISSINEISRAQADNIKLPNHFSSISEVQVACTSNIITGTNANLEGLNQINNTHQNQLMNQTQQLQQPMFIITEMSEDALYKALNLS